MRGVKHVWCVINFFTATTAEREVVENVQNSDGDFLLQSDRVLQRALVNMTADARVTSSETVIPKRKSVLSMLSTSSRSTMANRLYARLAEDPGINVLSQSEGIEKVEQDKHAAFSTMPRTIIMGLVCGLLHVLGPDHLGTLLTLSAAASPRQAFSAGASWGLGHSLGMMSIAVAFLILRANVNHDLTTWEHWGHYVVGASMVLCALYFIVRENVYVSKNTDGTCVLQACTCHPAQSPIGTPDKLDDVTPLPTDPACCVPCGPQVFTAFRPLRSRAKPEPDDSLSNRTTDGQEDKSTEEKQVQEAQERTWTGAVLGIIQGVACPMGLVGLSFLANLPPRDLVVFLLIFAGLSTLGTGLLAMALAYFINLGVHTCLSARIAYRLSCGFTLLIGVLWIVANEYGFIEKLDFI